MKQCPACGKQYRSWKTLFGHFRWCEAYPEFKAWFEKQKETEPGTRFSTAATIWMEMNGIPNYTEVYHVKPPRTIPPERVGKV
jgi:hypothetical protein